MPKSAFLVLALTCVVALGWLVWGVLEYRRTGRTQWLLMAGVLVISIIAMFAQLHRLGG
jgi:uncharacterized membrane protein